jgi:PHD/YefM family antitoxin component YafN of YafNO toxin-antitoxin module
MPEGPSFESVSAEAAKARLLDLLMEVCGKKVRVEIVHGDSACVLISREELQSLENALEILANTSAVQRIANSIAALTHAAANGPLVVCGADNSGN